MKIEILTLFPEMCEELKTSVIKKAIEKGILEIGCTDIRDFAVNSNGRVDDYPYGGGAGLVIEAEPVMQAYESVKRDLPKNHKIIYTSPRGEKLTTAKAKELSKESALVIIAGHYEGIDERVLEELEVEHISIGDYVLTGGELPAMIIADATVRFIDGVLGNESSAIDESFDNYLIEFPQYTRPELWRNRKVPDILLSGNHGKINEYRLNQSKKLTEEIRPDLYEASRWSMREEILIGIEALQRLKNSKIAVFGLGGVGGTAAESLVRSGVGNLVIIDKDVVDITNFNRQIVADFNTLGKSKVEVAAKRFLSINKNLNLEKKELCFCEDTIDEIDWKSIDYIIDAIDTVTSKLLLIKLAKEKNIPIISCMGTGFRRNPTLLKVDYLEKSFNCPLAKVMRRELKKLNISKVEVVFSTEKPKKYASNHSYSSEIDNCQGRLPIGSMMFVPSTAGLLLSNTVINHILESK